jgi:hypothetical protein
MGPGPPAASTRFGSFEVAFVPELKQLHDAGYNILHPGMATAHSGGRMIFRIGITVAP